MREIVFITGHMISIVSWLELTLLINKLAISIMFEANKKVSYLQHWHLLGHHPDLPVWLYLGHKVDSSAGQTRHQSSQYRDYDSSHLSYLSFGWEFGYWNYFAKIQALWTCCFDYQHCHHLHFRFHLQSLQ